MLSEPLRRLSEELRELPGIGPRQALRIAYFIKSLGKQKIAIIANAVLGLTTLKVCEQCFLTHENAGGLCSICRDATRDRGVITIVERETDVLSIEKAGVYRGLYLVLGEIGRDSELSLDQRLRLDAFLDHLRVIGRIQEIIIAVNATMSGDIISQLIEQYLKQETTKITRLGRGLPTGGEIEFADPETLAHSLKNRQ